MNIEARIDPSFADEWRSVRSATSETMPSTIWIYSVELFAIRVGVREPVIAERHDRTIRSCANGEPVWMAVSALAAVHEAQRESVKSDREHLRSALDANEAARRAAGLGPGF